MPKFELLGTAQLPTSSLLPAAALERPTLQNAPFPLTGAGSPLFSTYMSATSLAPLAGFAGAPHGSTLPGTALLPPNPWALPRQQHAGLTRPSRPTPLAAAGPPAKALPLFAGAPTRA